MKHRIDPRTRGGTVKKPVSLFVSLSVAPKAAFSHFTFQKSQLHSQSHAQHPLPNNTPNTTHDHSSLRPQFCPFIYFFYFIEKPTHPTL